MSDDLDQLKCAIRDVLDERARMTPEQHSTEHAWVRMQMQRQQERAEFWKALLAKSAPTFAFSLLAAGVTWIWHWVVTHVTWR